MGCMGLGAFALVVWKELPSHDAASVLAAALLLWGAAAAGLWRLRKLHVYFSRQ
jgi:hypothetical protein